MNGAVRYGMDHVDTDLHRAFWLTRKIETQKIVPAPVLQVCNTVRINQSLTKCNERHPIVLVDAHPEYPRVIVRGDWT